MFKLIIDKLGPLGTLWQLILAYVIIGKVTVEYSHSLIDVMLAWGFKPELRHLLVISAIVLLWIISAMTIHGMTSMCRDKHTHLKENKNGIQ